MFSISCGFGCRPIEQNFTERLLGRLQLGATAAEVIAVLGKPDSERDTERRRHESFRYAAKGITSLRLCGIFTIFMVALRCRVKP